MILNLNIKVTNSKQHNQNKKKREFLEQIIRIKVKNILIKKNFTIFS